MTKPGNTTPYEFWLTFEAQDNRIRPGSAPRVTKNAPACGRNERAMKMRVELPRALFKTPQLSAIVSVAEPAEDTVNINIAATEEALRGALGADVRITVDEGSDSKTETTLWKRKHSLNSLSWPITTKRLAAPTITF